MTDVLTISSALYNEADDLSDGLTPHEFGFLHSNGSTIWCDSDGDLYLYPDGDAPTTSGNTISRTRRVIVSGGDRGYLPARFPADTVPEAWVAELRRVAAYLGVKLIERDHRTFPYTEVKTQLPALGSVRSITGVVKGVWRAQGAVRDSGGSLTPPVGTVAVILWVEE